VRRPVASGPALIPALLTGVTIAVYSTIDRVGVRLTAPWLYAWAIWAMTALLLAAWGLAGGWAGISSKLHVAVPAASLESIDPPESRRMALLVGSLMLVTYLLVLIAFRLAPLTIVAPLRESAIVLVTVWGVWQLREREGMVSKLVGAVVIVAGVVLLTL
jgi:drug/metabolite transporter (DMT)-like permease